MIIPKYKSPTRFDYLFKGGGGDLPEVKRPAPAPERGSSLAQQVSTARKERNLTNRRARKSTILTEDEFRKKTTLGS